jgi:hypothetical protein
MRPIPVAVIFVFSLVACACTATYSEKIAGVRTAYYNGDLAAARLEIANAIEASGPGEGEYDLFLLEDSLVQLASGNAKAAEERLRAVRDDLDKLEAEDLQSAMAEFGSYLTDDRFTVYKGEDYERLLVRVFLAFASLMAGGDDAVAYANQILEKQREILDQDSPDRTGRKYKSRYKKIGVGPYVYGMILEDSDSTGTSEASISYKRVQDWEPQYSAIAQDIQRVEQEAHTQKGNGVLYVFGFVGRGPVKVEVIENDLAMVSEISLQMVRFIDAFRDYGPTLDLSPIRVPDLVPHPESLVRNLSIWVDGEHKGTTETLTDVTATALQQYAQVRDWVLAKAILRRMIKKAITTGVKGVARQAVRRGDHKHQDAAFVAIEIAGALANTIWSGVERADTRHWSLLPDKIQAVRIEVPAGVHEVNVLPGAGQDVFGRKRSTRVRIVEGGHTYVFAFVPTPAAGPALLTSRPAGGIE